MQTNRRNYSPLFVRIMQIIDYYDIKNVSAFSRDFLKYDSPEKINRIKKEGKFPSFEVLADIANTFDKISMDWLVTGNGKMLKNSEKNGTTLYESQGSYYKNDDNEVSFLRAQIETLQLQNNNLVQIVDRLTKERNN